MPVSTGLAQLSEALWVGATGTYTLAVVAYTGEYAFGRRGAISRTSGQGATARSSAESPARARVLVGTASSVTAPSVTVPVPTGQPMPVALPTGRPKPRDTGAGRVWGRSAVALTIAGVLLHLGSVLIRGISVDRVPWGNMYEFTLVVGLIATLAWLGTLARMPQLRYLGMFVMMPVVLVMFLAGALYTKASKLVPALQSYWLAIHVSSIAVSEGILMTSAALTVMYLIRARYEKLGDAAELTGKRFAQWGSKLPASMTLDRAAYRTVAFAFPIYTAGIIFGAIWAEAAWGRYWGWDPKETWAFISWVIYAIYLHARATAGWKGGRAGWINIVGFLAMTFNFFVINIVVSGLHSYAGLS